MTRRIAMISEHASPLGAPGGVDSGGQNVYVGEVARGLAARGNRVDIFTRRDDETLPEVLCWGEGVRIVHVPAGPAEQLPKECLLPYMAEFQRWMHRFIQRERLHYDLLHANFWMSALVAADLKRELGIPFVVTFHALGRVRRRYQGDGDGFPDERIAIEDRVVAEADGIIAECPQDEEDLLLLYGADSRRLTIIPCGFSPAELWPVSKDIARVTLGLHPDEPLVLQLGRMVPRKGVETVVRSLARLRAEHGIAARLLIAGGESDEPNPEATPEIGRLQRIAEEESVADAVTFAGRVSRQQLKYYYSAADVFVTTPWYEPFGITPVEAMACGTPVVGAAVGGIKYTVRDGETGYLVPPNEPEALAGRLAHLLAHPELRERLGGRASQRATAAFTWERVVGEMAAFYEEVLAGAEHRTMDDAGAAVIDEAFRTLATAVEGARRSLRVPIVNVAGAIAACFRQGGKLLICGNGGSAADAQHFAAEFVGRFKAAGRPALPALALTADTAVLTAWSNDASFDEVFARQVEAFGCPGDVIVGISTSGRSRNVVQALERAKERGLQTVALLGGDGGDAVRHSDHTIIVPNADTQHVQELHTVVIHVLCDLVERYLHAGQDEPVTLAGGADGTMSTADDVVALPAVPQVSARRS